MADGEPRGNPNVLTGFPHIPNIFYLIPPQIAVPPDLRLRSAVIFSPRIASAMGPNLRYVEISTRRIPQIECRRIGIRCGAISAPPRIEGGGREN